jgi:hypothetical protein
MENLYVNMTLEIRPYLQDSLEYNLGRFSKLFRSITLPLNPY